MLFGKKKKEQQEKEREELRQVLADLKKENQEPLTSLDLRQLHKIYLEQFDELEEEEVVNKFMNQFKKFLKMELEEQNADKNPSEYLKDMSKIGAYQIYVYHGYVPNQYQDILRPFIRKYLMKVFNLKNFLGFGLKFHAKNNVGYFSTITLTWNPEDKAVNHVPTKRLSNETATADVNIVSNKPKIQQIPIIKVEQIQPVEVTDNNKRQERREERKQQRKDEKKLQNEIHGRLRKIDAHVRRIKNAQSFINSIQQQREEKTKKKQSNQPNQSNIKLDIQDESNSDQKQQQQQQQQPEKLSKSDILRRLSTRE